MSTIPTMPTNISASDMLLLQAAFAQQFPTQPVQITPLPLPGQPPVMQPPATQPPATQPTSSPVTATTLDMSIVAEGGTAATNEIASKMFGNIADPAEQQRLAAEALSILTASGAVQISAPSTQAASGVESTTLNDKIQGAQANSKFDINQLLAMLVDLAQKMRQADRGATMTDAETSENNQLEGADQTDQQAADTWSGGLASGIFQIAGGAVSAAAGSVALTKAVSASSTVGEMTPFHGEIAGETYDESPSDFSSRQTAQYNQLTQPSSNALQSSQGAQGALTGSGSMAQASYDEKGTEHSAEKQRHDADSTIAGARQDGDKDQSSSDEDLLKAVQNFNEQNEQTRHERNQAAI